MRISRCGLALLFAALGTGAAFGQYPTKILDARVGLPPGRFVGESDDEGRPANVVKNNTWAPVYVQLQIDKEVTKNAALVIETSDTDDLSNYTSVPLQSLAGVLPGTRIEPTELRYLPYVRVGGKGVVTVSLRVAGEGNPGDWRLLSEPRQVRKLRLRDVSRYVVLSLGSGLRGFDLPKEDADKDKEPDDANIVTSNRRALRNGRIETARITEVAELPDQWIGYEAADLVVLTTGTSDTFLTKLFTDPANKPRLDALLEWVRRGGKLVVSVGANAGLVAQLKILQEILPMTVRLDPPATQVNELPIVWGLAKTNRPLGSLVAKGGGPFPVANLDPKSDRGFRTLVPANDEGRRVVVQAPYGLGRVTLVALDLERSPFVDYAGKAEFWDLLLREAGSPRASTGLEGKAYGNKNGFNQSDSEDELAAGLRTFIDHFDGVPVISFGWVALFILLYTLLIGPVEYFFLKKVFKRLELTWITFPVIVLTVSAIAYFTAYAMKGNDLKVNKVDVLDIDPASGRVYGRTWFTIFSPRPANYRLGIDPAPGWLDAAPETAHSGGGIDWFGGSRGAREGLFRRSYFYKLDPPGAANPVPFGNGLIDVPIPVWSTKAFSAEWSGFIDKAKPLVTSDLIHPPADPLTVTGTITLNLPLAEVKGAYLLYAGRAYKYDNPIPPGGMINVFLDEKATDPNWLSTFGASAATVSTVQRSTRMGRTNDVTSMGPASLGIADGLFHEENLAGNDGRAPANSTLRRLDQSWRLSSKNRDEVIIIARLSTTKGLAEEVLTAANSTSPTRLWLKDLPGGSRPREAVPGTLQQDTFLRVYVPVKVR